jgi:type I restriction enzyme S subunit
MSNWSSVRLGDIVELRSGGTPSKARTEYWNGDLPWVSPKDVKVPRLHDTEEFVTDAAVGNGTRAVNAGTILMVVRSMILAREVPLTLVQRRMAFNQDIKAIHPHPEIDAGFLWAWLLANRANILGIVDEAGHGTKRVQTDRLLALPVKLPPANTQRRIASILGAYDDLIEVNRKRIALLEEMARRLFEEWFVRFRFPGHEGHPMVESPEGPLPEGWNCARFDSLAVEVRDAVDPRNIKGETPYVGLEHISRRSTTLSECGRADSVKSLKLKFRTGDVLFGKIRPYFHKVAWAPFEGVTSSDTIVFRSRSSTFAGLVLSVASSDQFVAHSVRTSNGTKMPRANPAVLARYAVPLPPGDLLEKFNASVLASIELAASLNAANKRLAASRDLLLPRLMSGELSISAADRELEDAA